MSYLHTPRLVFTGDFLSDVSTVNNDPAHYNNATFQPSYQEQQTAAAPNGWWNPEGGASFNLQKCTVQQITLADGTVLADPAADSVLGLIVSSSEGRPTGKMVDLDPDMQMVSALWCVQIRLCTPANEVLLQGDLLTTAFRDLQMRQTDDARKTNGQPMGGTWTSVLTNLVWGEQAGHSPYLAALRATTHDNRLSVNLNAFGYHYSHTPDGRFSLGRIIGAIGPWFRGEPDTFAPARRLYGMLNGSFLQTSNFIVESQAKRLTVDFGSSFPVANSMGSIDISQGFMLAVNRGKQQISAVPASPPAYTYLGPEDFMELGKLAYRTGPDWLNQTGGIVSISALSDEALRLLAQNQLLLLTSSGTKPGQFAVVAREALNGLVVRADNFVQRLDTGDTHDVGFYAYQWGKPLASTTLVATQAAPTPDTPKGAGNPISELYGNNFPVNGLTFPSQITTDAKGFAKLPVTGNAIHSPRHYLDGQIYTITYQLQGIPNDYDNFASFNDAVVVHLRDAFELAGRPTWEDIAPTMTQYSNLYPIMSKYLVNLADPASLLAQKAILQFAFSRDINDTMHMPVTRDLSRAKRQAILDWLSNPEAAAATSNPEKLMLGSEPAAQDSNPVPVQTPLTVDQQKYLEAVKAKNGGKYAFPVVTNLFENI